MEANTAAFPSQLGHDMDEEKRMLMLLHLVGFKINLYRRVPAYENLMKIRSFS
jgi:hypothetical protein